jgi:hypothetical protein
MARASLLNRSGRHGHTSDLRAVLSFIIERALVLLDELDCDPDAEPSLCGLVVGPGNDQDRKGEDDNGVADSGGDAWVRGGTYPLPPERIPTRRRVRSRRR